MPIILNKASGDEPHFILIQVTLSVVLLPIILMRCFVGSAGYDPASLVFQTSAFTRLAYSLYYPCQSLF